jgi:hypothetical protein
MNRYTVRYNETDRKWHVFDKQAGCAVSGTSTDNEYIAKAEAAKMNAAVNSQ